MGYTVYWETKPGKRITESEARIIFSKIKALISENKRAIRIETTGTRRLLDQEKSEIGFNGIGRLGHETFFFGGKGEIRFAFCKTARMPYDRYVKMALMMMQDVTKGKLILSQDGGNEETDPPGWNKYVRLG